MSAAKILFAGTPEFARVSLQALVENGYTPGVVLTQPDRPAGRGKKLSRSPVKQYAQSLRIEVLQPATMKDDAIAARLESLQPDLLIVAAYGLILPQKILDIPRRGCINVHASLLPRWRGAAPIQMAILHGDDETGISIMQMEAGLDTGPVYARSATPVKAGETCGELHDRLALLGGDLLVQTIADVLQDRVQPEIQDSALATYAPKIEKRDAAIDWSADAASILRQIRAYNPVPGARFDFAGETIKCWQAELVTGLDGEPGQVVKAAKGGIDVACGADGIRLTEVQRPGRKKISGAQFAAQSALVAKRFG